MSLQIPTRPRAFSLPPGERMGRTPFRTTTLLPEALGLTEEELRRGARRSFEVSPLGRRTPVARVPRSSFRREARSLSPVASPSPVRQLSPSPPRQLSPVRQLSPSPPRQLSPVRQPGPEMRRRGRRSGPAEQHILGDKEFLRLVESFPPSCTPALYFAQYNVPLNDRPVVPSPNELLLDGSARFDDRFYKIEKDNRDINFADQPAHVISTVGGDFNSTHALLKAASPIYNQTTDYTSRALLAQSVAYQAYDLAEEIIKQGSLNERLRTWLTNNHGSFDDLITDLSALGEDDPRKYSLESLLVPYALLLNVNPVIAHVVDGTLDVEDRDIAFPMDRTAPMVILVERYGHYEPYAIKQNGQTQTIFYPDDLVYRKVKT